MQVGKCLRFPVNILSDVRAAMRSLIVVVSCLLMLGEWLCIVGHHWVSSKVKTFQGIRSKVESKK